MRRFNPKTGKPFKLGDNRNKDSLTFKAYSLNKNTIYKTGDRKGYYKEIWQSEESAENQRTNRKPSPNATVVREKYLKNQAKIIEETNPTRRLNPLTKKEFIRGDYDPKTNKYFEAYKNYMVVNGYIAERWESLDKFIRSNFAHLCRHTRKRAKKHSVPHNIDIEYLMSIFPKDGKCPVFKTKFSWGLDFVSTNDGMKERISPSVDKIIPYKGYVKGNIAFISVKANGIKADATVEELIEVTKWLRKVSR